MAMKEFLDGVRDIEERSRKYKADIILSVAKMFANKEGRKRRRDESSSESDEN